MVKKNYVPERGDIVWLTFDPQAGHEQAGRRPALVLSPKKYNVVSGLALFCPLTSSIKGYPFEVQVDKRSCILVDQVKSLDWRARQAELRESLGKNKLLEVQEKLVALLE